MMNYSLALLKSFFRPVFAYLFVLALTVMTVFSFLIILVEGPHNPAIGSWVDSFYFVTATMTSVGYGDIVPLTVFGKILAIAMMLLGTALFVSFTAVLASSILEIEMKGEEL